MFIKIFYAIKNVIFWFWNPKSKPFRDANGKVIDDFVRRKHSKEIRKKIESGEIKLQQKGEGPRCYRIESKGKIVLIKKQESK